MSVIDEIAAERARQIEVEGWTPEHDDSHISGSLAGAAACYAISDRVQRIQAARPGPGTTFFDRLWPWDLNWWKPKDRRRDLIRAGALIVAEIERIDRAENNSQDASHGR